MQTPDELGSGGSPTQRSLVNGAASSDRIRDLQQASQQLARLEKASELMGRISVSEVEDVFNRTQGMFAKVKGRSRDRQRAFALVRKMSSLAAWLDRRWSAFASKPVGDSSTFAVGGMLHIVELLQADLNEMRLLVAKWKKEVR